MIRRRVGGPVHLANRPQNAAVVEIF